MLAATSRFHHFTTHVGCRVVVSLTLLRIMLYGLLRTICYVGCMRLCVVCVCPWTCLAPFCLYILCMHGLVCMVVRACYVWLSWMYAMHKCSSFLSFETCISFPCYKSHQSTSLQNGSRDSCPR
jgi:hypothetical protein